MYQDKTFQGWYTAKTGGDKVEAGKTKFTKPTTLYAHWKDYVGVKVSLDANGGTTVRTHTYTTVYPGVLPEKLPTPARTGYKFVGWYTERTNGYLVTDAEIYEADTQLYAHWQRAVSRTGNPKTGDQVRLELAGTVLAAAAVGLVAAVVIKKRKKS